MKLLQSIQQELRDEIVRDLDRHMKDAEQFDDITIATVIL